MNIENLGLRLWSNAAWRTIEARIWYEEPHTRKRFHAQIIINESDDGEIKRGVAHPPDFTLTNEAAQEIMTDLWNSGIRPANFEDSRGHLEDMRRIAFDMLDIKLP